MSKASPAILGEAIEIAAEGHQRLNLRAMLCLQVLGLGRKCLLQPASQSQVCTTLTGLPSTQKEMLGKARVCLLLNL